MTAFVSRFLAGFMSPIKGLKFVFSGPKVWWLTIIPVVVTTALMIYGLTYGLSQFVGFLDATIASYVSSAWIKWTLVFLGYLVYFVLLIFLILIVSRIVLVPFNSAIAEKILKHMGVLKSENIVFSAWVRKSLRLLWISLVQVVFFSVVAIILFLLSFIPVLQLASVAAGLLVVAFDCSDYALELADLGFRQKMGLFKRRLPEFAGLGTMVGLTFTVPLLNFFFLPIAVIGATRLVAGFEELWPSAVKEV